MTDSASSTSGIGFHRIFPGLVVLLLVFPPETDGRSYVASSILAGAIAILGWTSGGWPRSLWLAACGWTWLALVFLHPFAPGLPVVAMFLIAVALGLSARDFPSSSGLWNAVLWSLCGATAVVSSQAIYQFVAGLQQLAQVLEQIPGLADRDQLIARALDGRAFANFMTPAALGGFYALAIPALAGFWFVRKGRDRWLLALTVALALAGLAASASATGLAALAAGAILGLGIRAWGRSSWSGAWRIAFAGFAVLALLAVSLGTIRGSSLLDPASARGPLRLRLGNFRAASEIIGQHPWVGCGPGGFADAYASVRQPGDNETRHVHNLPLEFMAEWGLPVGIAASLAFFILFAIPVGRIGRPKIPASTAGVAVGLFGFAVHNLADFTALMPSLLWTAAILCGLLWPRLEQGVGEDRGPGLGPERIAAATAPRWASAALLALCCAVLAMGGVSRDLRDSARYADPERGTEWRLGQATRATAWAPWDTAAALLAAQLSMVDGLSSAEVSDGLANRVVELSPKNAEAFAVRAQSRLRIGDHPGAYADLMQASRLHPIYPSYADALKLLSERLGIPENIEDDGTLP